MLPSIPPAHQRQRDGDAQHRPVRQSPTSPARQRNIQAEGAEDPWALGGWWHQAGRAWALLCRHGVARGAQSVALILPCPVRSQIPFTSMSACSVRPAPGETARRDGGEDLLKRHCF